MASTRRKSAAIALAVIGIAGLSLASAAQLNITSGSLGAGTTLVAPCDANGIGVSYTNAFGAGNVYNTTAVSLTGVADACTLLDYKVQLLQGPVGSQTPLGGELSGADLTFTVVAAGNNTATLTLPVALAAADITGISVVISG